MSGLTELERELRGALRSLANEIGGWPVIELRRVGGNTNVEALLAKQHKATQILALADAKEQGE